MRTLHPGKVTFRGPTWYVLVTEFWTTKYITLYHTKQHHVEMSDHLFIHENYSPTKNCPSQNLGVILFVYCNPVPDGANHVNELLAVANSGT